MLPEDIKQTLKANQVCCLGSCHEDEPYLSLMFYTFLEDEELLIMSSQTESTKIRNIKANPKTVVLVQSNPQSDLSLGITLSGTTQLETGYRAANYLKIHQHTHSLDSDFFTGKNITVISFHPTSAIIADRKDNVRFWSSNAG